MGLGSVTSGILSDVSGLHSDLADFKTDLKGLRRANKQFNGRKVAAFSALARRHTKPGFKKTSSKSFSQGSWKVTKSRKQQIRQHIQQHYSKGSTRSIAGASPPTRKAATFTDTPRGLLEMQRQNKALQAQATKTPPKAEGTFGLMGQMVSEVKTLKHALEFKKTLDHHATKGFNSEQTAELQTKLTTQLQRIAIKDNIAFLFTDEVINKLVNSEEDKNALRQIRNQQPSDSIQALEARLKILKGTDNLPSEEQLQQRLNKLKGYDKLPSEAELRQRLDDLRRK